VPQPTKEELAQLDNWFAYHKPSADQIDDYAILRAAAKEFALVIVKTCPPSADRTVAIRHVRDAVMSANASIACEGK
jgi:hypothetical protein